MLSIASLSAQHAAHYYSADNYCSKEEAQVGSQWQGKATEQLALSGSVETKTFSQLLQGQTPAGRSLQQRIGINHTAGIDLTFSAPKSISLAALWGADTALRAVHEQAIRISLEAIETYSGTRLWHGSEAHYKRFYLTGNLVIAQFAHTTSRAQDPQLHTHNIVLNTTHTGNDWRALDTRVLYKHRQLWQSIYHQELALGCQQLGYALSYESGHLELAGYSPEQLAYWSKRRQQIVQMVGTNASTVQKQMACLRTRPRKLSDRTLEALRQQWTTESREYRLNVEHPQPGVIHALDAAEQLGLARSALEHLTASFSSAASFSQISLIEQVFRTEDRNTAAKAFGYPALESAIAEAIEAGHLYKHGDHLSRSTNVPVSKPCPAGKQISTPYPNTDAAGFFAQDIAQGKRTLLVAPIDHHEQLTRAIRRRLWQLGKLTSPRCVSQQIVDSTIETVICVGDRLRIPGRINQVQVQIEPSDNDDDFLLRHRNGKITAWQLNQPKPFEFDWVQAPNSPLKQRIEAIHVVGDINETVLKKLQKKAHITTYKKAGPSISLQSEQDRISVPSPDPGLETER